MRYGCGSRNIGRTSFTCLITEQSTLDTIHHRGSQSASCYLFKTEGIADDDFENMRHKMYIHQYDDESQYKIPDSHDGNDNRTHFSDALNASKNDGQRHHYQHNTRQYLIPTECLVHRLTNRIALNGIVRKSKCNRDENGKQG